MFSSNDAARTNSTTIVSAFVGGINSREDRIIDHYIEYGKQLLSIDIPKIIFMDVHTYSTYFEESATTYPYTTFIPIMESDMYLFQYKDRTEKFDIITKNPKKDTIEYIFVQCMKTEWVRQAIEKNPYGSSQFIWIDFGIYHFIRDASILKEGIYHMSRCSYDKVRIPCGKPPNFPYFSKNLYHHIVWLFLGSVFGGGKESLLKFADLVKTRCIEILEEKHHLMWEINIWFLVFFENIHLFDRYICSHNPKMLFDY